MKTEKNVRKSSKNSEELTKRNFIKLEYSRTNGITLVALVVTIVLNCSYLAMVGVN